jgi:hypothetical protein
MPRVALALAECNDRVFRIVVPDSDGNQNGGRSGQLNARSTEPCPPLAAYLESCNFRNQDYAKKYKTDMD